MFTLGFDPGLINIGWAFCKDGDPVEVGTLHPPSGALPVVLSSLYPLLRYLGNPTAVAVEEVTWYGRGRRGMLPLAHVAGFIVGHYLSEDIDCFLYLANQRRTVRLPKKARAWDDHQKDAAAMGILAWRAIRSLRLGKRASGAKDPLRPLQSRLISVTNTVRGNR